MAGIPLVDLSGPLSRGICNNSWLIGSTTGENRPSDARKLVGQRYGHDIAAGSCEQSLKPTAERRIFLGEPRKSRARPVDQ